MKFVNNILYIEFPELVKSGIKERTVWNAKYKKSSSWQFITDPDDKRKVLIEYESLRPRYQDLIINKLCGGITPYQYLATQIINKHLFAKPSDIEFFKNHTTSEGSYLPHKTQQKAIEACKYLYMLERYGKATAKKEAFPMWPVNEFWSNLEAHIKANPEFREKSGVNMPFVRARINNLAKMYLKNGPVAVLSNRMGNKNSSKLGKSIIKQDINSIKYSSYNEDLYNIQMALLSELRAHPNNFDWVQITESYNMAARTKGWPELTPKAVEGILKDAKHDRITLPGRKGAKAYYNNVSMQVKRKRPSQPMQYFTVDGWTVELVYQGYAGDKYMYSLRHVMVVVLDAYDDYPIGYAIGDRETAELIKMAMRNAINHTKELTGQYIQPWQIQSDRYALKQMTEFYGAVSHLFTPARVGNAKSKVVEPYFRYLNKKYCQLQPNWSGFNLTSRKENQPNMEFKDKIKDTFPDKLGNIKQIISIINKERAIKGNDYVKALQSADKMIMSRADYLSILGTATERTIRLNGAGLSPVINGQRMHYDSFDMEFRNHAHRDWTVKFDPDNLENVLVEAEEGKYKFMLTKKHEQPMSVKEQTEEDRRMLKEVNDFKKADVSYIAAKRAESISLVQQFMADNPELAETNLKMMLTVSGQQKEGLQDAKMLGAAKKVIEKVKKKREKEEEKSFQERRQEYLKSKGIDFSKYM